MLTYTNSYKQASCSKEISQAQIMIFCNRDVDAVRWFEDLDWSALLWDIFDERSNVLVLVVF